MSPGVAIWNSSSARPVQARVALRRVEGDRRRRFCGARAPFSTRAKGCDAQSARIARRRALPIRCAGADAPGPSLPRSRPRPGRRITTAGSADRRRRRDRGRPCPRPRSRARRASPGAIWTALPQTCLGERMRAFLQPRIVGEAAVPDARGRATARASARAAGFRRRQLRTDAAPAAAPAAAALSAMTPSCSAVATSARNRRSAAGAPASAASGRSASSGSPASSGEKLVAGAAVVEALDQRLHQRGGAVGRARVAPAFETDGSAADANGSSAPSRRGKARDGR